MNEEADLEADDFPIDFDTAYCPSCDEERRLPENTEVCPFCGCDKLTFVW